MAFILPRGMVYIPFHTNYLNWGCNYLHDVRGWKWWFSILSPGIPALGMQPPCPDDEELKPQSHWALGWRVSEPSWQHIRFPTIKPPRLTLRGADTCSFSELYPNYRFVSKILLLYSVISLGEVYYATADSWNIQFAIPLQFIFPTLHYHLSNFCLTIQSFNKYILNIDVLDSFSDTRKYMSE